MQHGYTNDTERVGNLVVKRYAGPDIPLRAAAERHALTALARAIPMPNLVASAADSVTTEFTPGSHGQDLIDAGRAAEVLTECGRLLRKLHSLEPGRFGFGDAAGVIQHGDFGPNNLLFEPGVLQVTAVLDWEFSAVGPAIADLAWCEWIVRMHHRAAVTALPHLFDAYGVRPPWSVRRAEMVRRCEYLGDFCRRWNAGHPGIAVWHERSRQTSAWSE